jgi:glycerol-3-phosphate acyltransferase PlsY
MLIIPVLFSILGFLMGGVLFSYHIPKRLKKVDVVALSPDHNPGTANAMKLCGVPIGLTCLLLDLLKGCLPVWGALRLMRIDDPMLALVIVAPVLGHALAVFYPFRGGKAVAVSFGALLGLLPQSLAVFALVLPYLFFSLVVVLHPNERKTVASFFCLAVLCLIGALYTHRIGVAMGVAGMALVAMWKNRVRASEPADVQPAVVQKH